jgi:hypothetical protein
MTVDLSACKCPRDEAEALVHNRGCPAVIVRGRPQQEDPVSEPMPEQLPVPSPSLEVRWAGPSNASVRVDGHDVSRWLTGIRFEVQARDIPAAVLEFAPLDALIGAGRTDIAVDPDLHATLVRLGWLPPGELLSVTEDTSDGDHTFARAVRPARRAARRVRPRPPPPVQPGLAHEGPPPRRPAPMFAGYFLVQLDLPTGPVSYHVRLEHWDDFAALYARAHADPWDGHTTNDVVRALVDYATYPDGIITTDAHITSIPADIEYRLRSALHREVHRLAPDPLTGNGTGYPLGILNAGHPDALAMARANLAYDDPEVAAHVAQWSDPTTDPTAIDDERARARDAADGLDDFRRVATRFTRRIADAFDVPPDRVTADPHLPGRWHTPDGTLEHHPVGAHAWYRASGGWTRHYWDPTPPDTDANPLRSACGAWEITPDQLRHAPDRRCCRHCLTVLTARYEGKKRRDQRQSG